MCPVYSTVIHGIIARDMTWGPANNPYIVDGFIYVHATLTILPGTQILVKAANGNTNWNGFSWSGTTEPVAKMFVVTGRIIAKGTEAQPISFDRYEDNPTWRWGGIYMTETAPMSSFEYCNFNNTLLCDYAPNQRSTGALNFSNGVINVRHCVFYDNMTALVCCFLTQPVLIYDCKFISEHILDYNYYASSFVFTGIYNISEPPPEIFPDVTIAKCTFTGILDTNIVGYYMNVLFLNNKYINQQNQSYAKSERRDYGPYSMYGNYFSNSDRLFGAGAYAENDTAYCRRNYAYSEDLATNQISGADGVSGSTVFYTDNYLYGNVTLQSQQVGYQNGYFYNNVVFTSAQYGVELDDNGNIEPLPNRFFNNTFVAISQLYDPYSAISSSAGATEVLNNTFYGFNNLLADVFNGLKFHNNIINGSEHIVFYDIFPSSVRFWNNCFDTSVLQLPSNSDGGGNIYADPLFADTLSHNFNLQASSPCINTGIVMDWMPEFDGNYNQRIADGMPDMGAFEYNSPYIGGINGMVYDALTNQTIDCAKISISGKLPEFTDSLGCFTYPTGAGTYTVKVSRWDYDDVIIPNVSVALGQHLQLQIPMLMITAIGDETHVPIPDSIILYNYPNPFRTDTTINFILPEKSSVKLTIYNLKGQKVKTLLNNVGNKGLNSVTWNGKDMDGKPVASGVYFTHIDTGKSSHTERIIVIK